MITINGRQLYSSCLCDRPSFDEFIITAYDIDDRKYLHHVISKSFGTYNEHIITVSDGKVTSTGVVILESCNIDNFPCIQVVFKLVPDYDWNNTHESFRYKGGYYEH